MRGHAILIVESDDGLFAHRLQEALERAGADALIALDNQTAISRLINLDFSAALVGQGHQNIAKYVHELGMRVIRYQLAHAQIEPLVCAVREAIQLAQC
jgi:ActR/RegA family two-component response regulator